ncbi:hypothetical protein [Agarivorans aestuarii]|uniref:hypothetical protein n=1 Tax=Agarivorans aestuarii TaxID=1563703 RepID=UPI001C80127C|nr:hypothetical protein [Agarivorans aestuarii]
MGHPIDFGNLEEKLFLIQQLSSASQENAKWKSSYLKSNKEEDWQVTELQIELEDDLALTETLISSYMIECAVKTRIFQDHFTEDHFECGFSSFDKDAIDSVGGDIGNVLNGSFTLSLRESCNKIIHAKKFYLIKENENLNIPYWNGLCHLTGTFQKKEWKIELDVRNWAAAINYYHSSLQEERSEFWNNNES